MKRLLVLTVLLAIALGMFMTGCSSKQPLTVAETASEVKRRDARITNLQLRMLLEDWDYIWLYDRSAQTSRWHTWVGI